MASREPMWFCHECGAEMRPLMVPDPHCASCNGTFVEKIENPSDDPRQYHIPGGGAEFPGDDENPLNPLDFLMGLQAAMPEIRPSSPRARDRPRSPQFTSNASTFSIRIDRTGDGPARTVFSSSRSPPTRADSIPGMFERGGNGNGRRPEGANITGALMFQYLATLLAQSGRNMPPNPMFAEMMGGAEPGRMGDYVFSQEALDQIMTQLMESSSSHPVAATEEIIQNLPKVVLEEGSLLLEKDCAVCKDQFQLGTEDPSEQVVITLPCKHPFHEGCIVPWLKSSGTCPVCRYELIPQPHHHGPGEGPSRGSHTPGAGSRPGSPRTVFPGFGGFGGSGRSGNTGGDNSGNNPGGFLNMFSTLLSGGGSSSGTGNSTTHTNFTTSSTSAQNNSDNNRRSTDSPTHSRSDPSPSNRSPPGQRSGQRRSSSSRRSSDSGVSTHVPGSWSDVD